jgi:hypothetical protein
MKQHLKRIGIVGSATLDDIRIADRRYHKIGGVIPYAGLTYRYCGLSVIAVINLASRDSNIKSKLEAHGIETLSGKSRYTTHFINSQNGARRHQRLLQSARKIEFGQILPIMDTVEGLHLGPLHPLDIDPRVYLMIKYSAPKKFLDVQGLTRRIAGQQVQLEVSPHLAAGLQSAHIVKANGHEHRAMLSFYRLNPREFMHRFNIEEYVVTLGDKGGFVQTRMGEKISYNAASPLAGGDPTGAGDVFFAAYIANRFSKTLPVRDACRAAARLAARQVAGKFLTRAQLNA